MLIKQWKFLTTPTIRGAAMPGFWAQSDCAVLGFSQLLGVTSKGPPRQLLPTLPPLSPQTAQPSQAPADLYTSGSCFPLFPQPAGPVALLHLPSVVLGSVLPSETCPRLPWLPSHIGVTRMMGCGHWSSGKLSLKTPHNGQHLW